MSPNRFASLVPAFLPLAMIALRTRMAILGGAATGSDAQIRDAVVAAWRDVAGGRLASSAREALEATVADALAYRAAAARLRSDRAAVRAALVPVGRDERFRRDAAGRARSAWRNAGLPLPHSRWCAPQWVVATDAPDGEATASVATERGWVDYSSRERHEALVTATIAMRLPRCWRTRVSERELAVIDGLLTLDARPVEGAPAGTELYSATWVRTGRGHSVVVARGFVARRAQTAVHGSTARGALATLRQRTGEADADLSAQAAKARLALAVALGLVPGAVEAALAGVATATLRSLRSGLGARVTLGHSEAAGNCAAGTLDWAARHVEGEATATARQVLLAAITSGDRVRLAVAACVAAIRAARPAAVSASASAAA